MGDNSNLQSQKENKFYLFDDVDCANYFLERFCLLFNERFEGDVISFDCVCVAPTGKQNGVNKNMTYIVSKFGTRTNIPVNLNLLVRNRDTKQQHKLKGKSERIENVTHSVDVNGDVSGLNILVFDNTVITGATATDIFHKLKEKGAKTIIFFCIGLGSKAIDIDFDLNPTSRIKYASRIINAFHWPRVSAEMRAKYKLKKLEEIEDILLKDLLN
jgi:hypothetical protein